MTRTLPLQTRLARIEAPAAAESDTIEVVWSTGAEVRRYDFWSDSDYIEELDLRGADLSRLNGGASVLANHSTYSLGDIIGVVERAWIDGKEGRAEIRLSQRPELAGLRSDVASGIVRNLSVGYIVHEVKRERSADPSIPDRVRVTRFEPYEISLVSVPADPRAQVKRDGNQPEYPVTIIEEDTPMHEETKPDSGPDTVPMPDIDPKDDAHTEATTVSSTDIDAIVAERVQRELAAVRAREKTIRELCRSVRCADLADTLIESGATVEQAKDTLLKRWVETGGSELRQAVPNGKSGVDGSAIQRKLFNQVAGLE